MTDGGFRFGGWSGEAPRDRFSATSWPDDGVCLKNVTHDGYHLARDIRVAALWVFGHDTAAERYVLGPDDFLLEAFVYDDGSGPPLGTGPMPRTTIEAYNSTILGFIYARYRLKDAAIRPERTSDLFGPDDPGLVVEQKFLFTSYGLYPSHEPGAILPAARLFPITSFFTQNSKVRSVRVDYRFEMGLDLFLDPSAVGRLYAAAALAGDTTVADELCDHPCVAGVFRDHEDLPTSFDATSNLDALFAAYEKPVPFELCTYGLRQGLPVEAVTVDDERSLVKNTWDNIHIWGSATVDGKVIRQEAPSTPGAFHAFHLHWRWPRVVQRPTAFETLAVQVLTAAFETLAVQVLTGAKPDFGAPQHQGLDIGDDSLGGPLLDPRLPNQTIRFALTRPLAASQSDAASTRVFEDLFYSAATRKKPRPTGTGGDLVLWISFEAAAPVRTLELGGFQPLGFGGSFFVTGIYFAHNRESTLNPFKGTRGKEGQNPTSAQDWYRTPTGPG